MIKNQQLNTYLESLPVDEMTVWKQRLERLRNDCGCAVGSIITLIITGSWIIHSILNPAAGQTWQRMIWVGVIVLFVSATVGKLLGLALARMRFQFAVRNLRRRAMERC
jgi:hypothetical protein